MKDHLILMRDRQTVISVRDWFITAPGSTKTQCASTSSRLDLEPTDDDAVRGLGSAYVNLGKMAEAEETYKRAIAIRPNYWREYNALGALYMSEGRYSEAAGMLYPCNQSRARQLSRI